LLIALLASAVCHADKRTDFADPSIRLRPRPLWFWNDTTVTADVLIEQMEKSQSLSRYGGFGVLPFGKRFGPPYLGDEYFELYGRVLEKARDLGMTMSLYDEYGFPSGSAGAPNSSRISLFAQMYPKLTIKRLDKHEEAVRGPQLYERTIPPSKLMSIVAMNDKTRQRIDITDNASAGKIRWDVPEGQWRVMIFVCVRSGYPACDYLDPEAADKFIEITHQAYYDRFSEYFGTTIDSTFFDEPTMYRAEGRTWTDKFNEKFTAKHGFSPRAYYPALWYDIGEETQAARNYLFGFRAELYATGFTKRIQDWCDMRGIEATGHQDQEEVVNPVSVSGDLMKCFKYLAIPGIDKIGGDRPAERFYKVVSSAAYNWDRALVMSETYGAMGDISWKEIYTIAMEQYTKGINVLIPHAVWYDDEKVIFKPELSYRSPIYAEGLAAFNTYISRLNVMLQNDAGHICDIAVVYPITTLQGSHYLDGPLGFYRGGVEVPEADYVDVGELLIAKSGRDFTFLHPQVLDEKCMIQGNRLILKNRIHPGQFRVLVLPGHETIKWSNLQKMKEFYDQGGKVITTGLLPSKSAEFGHDSDVVRTIAEMFANGTSADTKDIAVNANDSGGRAIRLSRLDATTLAKALDAAEDVYDVEFEGDAVLRYIHKFKDGMHVYLFANVGATAVDTQVRLRGRLEGEVWDPHEGSIRQGEFRHEGQGAGEITVARVMLEPAASLFLIGR
jgi:hypothetical protein